MDSGGLARRLRILRRAAQVLSHLHGMPIIYSDPSPANILISEDAAHIEVQFIDADNLRYETGSSSPGVFTPGFGAPELVTQQSGANTLTDAHAFSVIAYQTLTAAHPLLGDRVVEGPPELEDMALSGQLPWIDDELNQSNYSSSGVLPRTKVISRGLRQLFERSFSVGLNDARKRPGMSEWVSRLELASPTALLPVPHVALLITPPVLCVCGALIRNPLGSS